MFEVNDMIFIHLVLQLYVPKALELKELLNFSQTPIFTSNFVVDLN